MNLGVGLTVGVVLHTLQLPNPLPCAVVCGVPNFIPYIGPFIIAMLLLVAGAPSLDLPGAIAAPGLAFVLVHAVERNLVSPWVLWRRWGGSGAAAGRQLQLCPLAISLSVMFWGGLWGVAGAAIAVSMLIGIHGVCWRRRALRQV